MCYILISAPSRGRDGLTLVTAKPPCQMQRVMEPLPCVKHIHCSLVNITGEICKDILMSDQCLWAVPQDREYDSPWTMAYCHLLALKTMENGKRKRKRKIKSFQMPSHRSFSSNSHLLSVSWLLALQLHLCHKEIWQYITLKKTAYVREGKLLLCVSNKGKIEV